MSIQAALALVSRNGTLIIALSVVIGLAFPSLAAAIRPYLPEFVVVLLTLALLRVDFAAFLARLRRPGRAIAASLWTSLATPLVFLGAARLLGVGAIDPALVVVVFLLTATPPIMSTPTFTALMGLDSALSLAVLIVGLLATPLTAPLMAALFVAPDLPLSVQGLAGRLAVIIGIGFAVTLAIRGLAGAERVQRAHTAIDTVAIATVTLFAIAAMAGVREGFLARPGLTTAVLVASYAAALGNMALAYAVFRPLFGVDAVAIAYAAGNRNMGLMVSALGVLAIPDLVWLFFALGQLPIFTFPFLLQRLGRRLAQAA